ncbi:hypothetical protein M9Y10_004696 [Tritrichomonas musculus]|uniref:Uncharacterized protein n=1 Tax=Tritrichomonas musculus TaxID=1915356 RepID=A0ABR2JJC8_9EUKA
MSQPFVFVPRTFCFSQQRKYDECYSAPYGSISFWSRDYYSKLRDEEYKKFVESEKVRKEQEMNAWFQRQAAEQRRLNEERQRLGIPQLEQTIQQQAQIIQQLQQQLQQFQPASSKTSSDKFA